MKSERSQDELAQIRMALGLAPPVGKCKWGDIISLEYGKPVPDKETINGIYPVFGTNGQIGTTNLPPLCPIFVEEQFGKDRAECGAYLIKSLERTIEPEFGSGFSYRQLAYCRQFYRAFPIVNALRSQFNWSQYRLLIAIEDMDIGQLQMYVNYYDRYEKTADENPTVGILLCAKKNDAVVKMTLPESNSTILASQYQLHLPSEKALLEEINEVLELADNIKE